MGQSTSREGDGRDDAERTAYEGYLSLLVAASNVDDHDEDDTAHTTATWVRRYGVLQSRELRLYARESDYRAGTPLTECVPLAHAAASRGVGAAKDEVTIAFYAADRPRIKLRAAYAGASPDEVAAETMTWLRKLQIASREPWADPSSRECFVCSATFDVATRQHHCRRCGVTVCAKCSPDREELPLYAFDTPVRVCVACRGQRGPVPPLLTRVARRQAAHAEVARAMGVATKLPSLPQTLHEAERRRKMTFEVGSAFSDATFVLPLPDVSGESPVGGVRTGLITRDTPSDTMRRFTQ